MSVIVLSAAQLPVILDAVTKKERIDVGLRWSLITTK